MDARFRWTFTLVGLTIASLMMYVLYVIAGNIEQPTASTPTPLASGAVPPACAQAQLMDVSQRVAQGWSVGVASVAAVPVTVSQSQADGVVSSGEGKTLALGDTLAGPTLPKGEVQAWSGVTPAQTAGAGLNVVVIRQVGPDGQPVASPVVGEPWTYVLAYPLAGDKVTVRCDATTAYAVPLSTLVETATGRS